MLSATSKTSFRLSEMTITARPLSRNRPMRSSTILVWTTPSAAVGSSMSTSFEFHITALATATDWRCPPDSDATGWRMDFTVVTRRLDSVSAAERSMLSSSSGPLPGRDVELDVVQRLDRAEMLVQPSDLQQRLACRLGLGDGSRHINFIISA